MTPKKPVNVRIDQDLLADYDAWCDRQGVSRTKAIEVHMERATGRRTLRPTPEKVPPARRDVVPNFKAEKAKR